MFSFRPRINPLMSCKRLRYSVMVLFRVSRSHWLSVLPLTHSWVSNVPVWRRCQRLSTSWSDHTCVCFLSTCNTPCTWLLIAAYAHISIAKTEDKNTSHCSTHPRRCSSLWPEYLSNPHKKSAVRSGKYNDNKAYPINLSDCYKAGAWHPSFDLMANQSSVRVDS